jgi:predicted small lipoprotein YifL
MTMKNMFKYFAILITAIAVLSACDQKTEELYFPIGDENVTTTQYLQFSSVNPVFAMTPTITEAFTAEVGVSILGPAASQEITVTINVVSNQLSAAQVTLATTTLTIAENTTKASTFITIDPNAFSLDPDTLKMELSLSASGFEMAPYGSVTTYQFIYNVCPFDILNFLGGFTCDETGYGEYGVNFFADPTVPNRIHNTNFWDYAAAGSTVYYDFSGDENQTITIPDQPFTFGGGEVGSIVGTGTYDACTSTFYTLTDVTYEGSVYETEHSFFKGKSVIKTTIPKELLVRKK